MAFRDPARKVQSSAIVPRHRSHVVDALQAMATLGTCRRGDEIYRRDDTAENWYCIMAGVARKSAVMLDGHRRIVDFLIPGDFFGFAARNKHAFAVEAVVDGTVIARYPRARAELALGDDPQLERFIRARAFETISRLQARTFILGRITAQQKVGAFLIEISDRLAASDQDGFTLPMSRYDIADYLNLSVETVSRAFTRLRKSGAIEFTGPHSVRIVDRRKIETTPELSGEPQ